MIKLHELPADPGKAQKRRRVGRGEGSGWGRTSGKGEKGQQARAGSGKGASFQGGTMPFIRRIPKFGFDNTKFRAVRGEVTLGQLERHFEAGATVDLEALHKARLIQKGTRRVRVLATGELSKKLTVHAHGFTAGARAAIEGAGGACETVES